MSKVSEILEKLMKIQVAEQFIPSFSERKRDDRIRAASLAKQKLELQNQLRKIHPELTDQEFRKHWVALCTINTLAV